MTESQKNQAALQASDHRSGKERRSGEVRRQRTDPWTGSERRIGLTDRRGGIDRRILLIGLIHSTDGKVGDLEEWLGSNCDGKWHLEIIGTDDASSTQTLRVMFELEADKAHFQGWVKSR